MAKRSCEALPLSEKVKVLDLKKKEEKSYAEVVKINGKNESCKPGNRDKAKRNRLLLLPRLRLPKLWPQSMISA